MTWGSFRDKKERSWEKTGLCLYMKCTFLAHSTSLAPSPTLQVSALGLLTISSTVASMMSIARRFGSGIISRLALLNTRSHSHEVASTDRRSRAYCESVGNRERLATHQPITSKSLLRSTSVIGSAIYCSNSERIGRLFAPKRYSSKRLCLGPKAGVGVGVNTRYSCF